MSDTAYVSKSDETNTHLVPPLDGTTSTGVPNIDQPVKSVSVGAKNVEGAVYGYIQAVRSLGRTRINSIEISRALGLPLGSVEHALQKLEAKGVKTVG